MNDKIEDRSLFVLLVHVHFFRYQISDIEYQISQNTQTREDSIAKIVITLENITDKTVD